MNMQKKIWVLLSLIVYTAQSLIAQENKADYIVNKAFDAIGGRSLWESTSAYLEVSDLFSASNKQNPNNIFNVYKLKTGIILYKKINNQDHLDRGLILEKDNLTDTISVCYIGGKYWMQMGHKKPFVINEVADNYTIPFYRASPIWILKADSIHYSDSLSSVEDFYEVLKVYFNGAISYLYFNNQSFLLEKSSSTTDGDELIINYGDFREIQGRIVPFLLESYINGALHMRTSRSIVKFDIELDSIYFKVPQYPPYYILAKPLKIETF